jgi:hypothetical protein
LLVLNLDHIRTLDGARPLPVVVAIGRNDLAPAAKRRIERGFVGGHLSPRADHARTDRQVGRSGRGEALSAASRSHDGHGVSAQR